jgi:hypothetical protein
MYSYSIMVRTNKKTSETTPAVETTTTAAKVVKKIKAVKDAAPVEAAALATPAPAKIDCDAPDMDSGMDCEFATQSTEFLSKLQQMSALISGLKSEFRVLEKKWSRELKAVQKINSKRKRKTGARAPSGFVKPTRISDELAGFLGKEKGTEMARTAVTRDINSYIRAHKLQDPENGRKINADTKLASLLKLKKTDELTYFNLQRYMSPHFAKSVKTETSETA